MSVASSIARAVSGKCAASIAGKQVALIASSSLAEAYLAAITTNGGTINEANSNKVTSLLDGIESSGLDRYLKALYLFHGNTYASASLNALNPLNVTGSFYGSFTGSPTLNANGGFTPATGKYFTSNFHPDGGGLTDLSGGGMFFYGTSDITGGEYPIGLASTFYLAPNADGTNASICVSGSGSAATKVATNGFHWGGREANSSTVKAYRNGVEYISASVAFSSHYAGGYVADYAVVGGRRNQPSALYNASTMPLRLAGFSKGLTSTQVQTFNTLIQEYVA